MIDERQQELAALYAFDLLEGEERSAFKAELSGSPELQALVRELRESSASLAFSVPQVTPPTELKAKVLARLGQPTVAPAASEPGKIIPFRPFVLIPWAIAAALAVGCFFFADRYVKTQAHTSVLQDEIALAEIGVTAARNQLEAERILSNKQLADATRELMQMNDLLAQSNGKIAEAARVMGETFTELDLTRAQLATQQTQVSQLDEKLAAAVSEATKLRDRLESEGTLAQYKIATLASLAGNSPQALAVAVWNPKTQEGVLRVEKLPALASDKDYQLWVIDPAYPSPVDGGVFTVDPDTGDAQISFRPNQRVNNAAQFAVSLERKGGVPKAEGPILLLGD
jgi:anti-sigma-K factor RskA